eukprot:maker-scaffold1182_size56756-snap-gene-0.8 protein:Tk09769 transcript:maker-scaffold1182_size56756-snap-gene-0.8-mRNA-1 annotation:"dehydrogenase reductase sdr family member 4"
MALRLWGLSLIRRPPTSSIHHKMTHRNFSDGAPKTRFGGKVAIVTASTDGIGLGIAKRLAEDGCKVMISSRKAANVSRALDELKALNLDVAGVTCHVAKAEDRENLVQETIQKFGTIDFLVSNAAVNPTYGSILDVTDEQWSKIFDVNVKSSFLLAKRIIPEITKQSTGGSIVFISSIGGLHPMPMIGAYSVSKTALLGLTKALSFECAPQGVRVNCIAPGVIRTKFAQAMTESEDISEIILNSLHIKRFGTPEDIAGMAAFLCSDDASYISGENFVVAGGAPSRL